MWAQTYEDLYTEACDDRLLHRFPSLTRPVPKPDVHETIRLLKRAEEMKDEPSAVDPVAWQRIRYPGDEGSFPRHPDGPFTVQIDGRIVEAEPLGDDRYRLPGGSVLKVSRRTGAIAVWEE